MSLIAVFRLVPTSEVWGMGISRPCVKLCNLTKKLCSFVYYYSGFVVFTRHVQEYACRGDIGGPLMYKDGDRYRLLGVAKETEHCVEKFMYGLFTEVLSNEVNTWINTITDNCNLALQDNILVPNK